MAARGVVDLGAGAASLGWERVHAATSALAVTLRRDGVGHGGVVVAVGSTGLETVLLVLAAWRCGAAISLVAPGAAVGARIAERVQASEATVACAPTARCAEIGPLLPAGAVLIDEDEVRRRCEAGTASVGAGGPVSWPPADASPDDVAILQATSGTTGAHRLVSVTWRMLIANLRAIAARLTLDDTDRFASWMPLYHDMGLVSFLALPAYLGARMTLLPTETFARSPGSLVEALAATRATMSGTTTFGLAMTERALRRHRADVDLSSLVRLPCGAELIDLEVAGRFVESGRRHGLRPDVLACAYGMAEATLAVSIRPPSTVADAADPSLVTWDRVGTQRFARTGPPVDGVEVRVIDARGAPRRDGEVGELEVRGECVFSGYVGLTAGQSGLRPGGWLRSGDLGYLVDGEVVIVGRTKDILIVGGRNVVPDDVERVVGELPGIRRVAAVPVQGAAGEGFAVVAESRPVSPTTARDIRVALRRALDLSPEIVEFVAKGAIPKTTSGKLRRGACRALLPDRRPAAGDRAPAGREQVSS